MPRNFKEIKITYRRIRGDMIQSFGAMSGFYDPKLPALLAESANVHLRDLRKIIHQQFYKIVYEILI